ncbi:MAG: HlyC/CorC family transporter [Chloroflexi bacterium]|nr:HlyC/CorC family transporter [Chloroflexota bacterium]
MLINIGRAEGSVEASEAALLQRVFTFGDRQVQEIVTPRPEVIWIEDSTTLEQFLTLYARHSHTRFPVYDGSMENVIGVLFNKDVVVAMGEGRLQPEDKVTGFLRPAFFVPETKTISSTFTEMQRHGHGMALTVDEFGGIAGLATLKQLLEVIVGAVSDEGTAPEEIFSKIGENTYSFDAGVGITEINEELELNLPEGEYQTVAGFLLSQLGYIPEPGEVVDYGAMKFIIRKMDGVRIDIVEVIR